MYEFSSTTTLNAIKLLISDLMYSTIYEDAMTKCKCGSKESLLKCISKSCLCTLNNWIADLYTIRILIVVQNNFEFQCKIQILFHSKSTNLIAIVYSNHTVNKLPGFCHVHAWKLCQKFSDIKRDANGNFGFISGLSI